MLRGHQLTLLTSKTDMTKHELSELVADKDDIIAHKDQVIAELKNRTEIMCAEFHEMLGSTLKLMKDHMAAKLIQVSTTTFCVVKQGSLSEHAKSTIMLERVVNVKTLPLCKVKRKRHFHHPKIFVRQDPENGDRNGKSNQEAYAAKLQDLTTVAR